MKEARIVLIEDNPADVLLVKMALKENGVRFSLTEFESGSEAVKVLCSVPPMETGPPDLILLDLNTPRTDGFEALEKLARCPNLAQVPIAILTSSKAQRDKQRAARAGARYIEKPDAQRFLFVGEYSSEGDDRGF